ncbi:MAG: TIGR02147 family protein [Pseudobdellovibrionaceae bacterium]
MIIFEYSNYKLFLQSYLKQLPKQGRGQLKMMAAYLSMHPTHVSQIVSGSKDFSIEQAYKLGKYLGLNKLEFEYFLLLIQKDRAGTHDLKQYLLEKMESLKKESANISKRIDQDRVLSDFEKSVFYSSWIYSAVRLFCSIGEGQNLDAIAVRFQLSRDKVVEITQFLLTTGLCQEVNGKIMIGALHTHIGMDSPLLQRHHANWRTKALQKIDSLNTSELMFTGPFSLSKTDFAKIRENLLQMISQTLKTVKASPAEDLACLNIDFFWLEK